MTLKRLVILVGAGAALAYFFDPRMGRSRRNQLVGRTRSIFRRTAQRTERKAKYLAGHAHGVQQRIAAARHEREPANDPTLVAKIGSEVLSHWKYPKGAIHINAENGVVYLRGQAENPDQINELEEKVRKTGGVAGVVNMLHLPGTPAPNKQEALEVSRRYAPT